MNLGELTRINDFESVVSFINEMIRDYKNYKKEEISSFGNYLVEFLLNEEIVFSNQTEAINRIERINDLRMCYKKIGEKEKIDSCLEIELKLGNYIQEIQKKYL